MWYLESTEKPGTYAARVFRGEEQIGFALATDDILLAALWACKHCAEVQQEMFAKKGHKTFIREMPEA